MVISVLYFFLILPWVGLVSVNVAVLGHANLLLGTLQSVFIVFPSKNGHLYPVNLDPPPIPLDGDSATIRNFGQNDTKRSRNDKSAVEEQ